jgi:hypothetical protein
VIVSDLSSRTQRQALFSQQSGRYLHTVDSAGRSTVPVLASGQDPIVVDTRGWAQGSDEQPRTRELTIRQRDVPIGRETDIVLEVSCRSLTSAGRRRRPAADATRT